MSEKMRTKTLVAFAMLAVVIPILWFGGIAMQVLMMAMAGVACYETVSLNRSDNSWLLCGIAFAACAVMIYCPMKDLPAVMMLWLTALFFIELVDGKINSDFVMYTYGITILIAGAIRCVYHLYELPQIGGFWYMFYIGLCAFGCDTGAYFVGSAIGRHKLIPHISPNKTWEGAIGGFVIGAALSMAFGFWKLSDLPASLIITASLLLPFTAQVGDLAFSSIKRHYGVKDFGNLFPGHGGVLDRVDSIIFCLVVFSGLMILWGI